MEIIKPSAITSEILCNGSNGIPLIMCTDIPRVKKKLKDAGYIKVSVNAELAKALLAYPIDERQKHVEKEFNRLYIGNNGEKIVKGAKKVADVGIKAKDLFIK